MNAKQELVKAYGVLFHVFVSRLFKWYNNNSRIFTLLDVYAEFFACDGRVIQRLAIQVLQDFTDMRPVRQDYVQALVYIGYTRNKVARMLDISAPTVYKDLARNEGKPIKNLYKTDADLIEAAKFINKYIELMEDVLPHVIIPMDE